MSANGHAVSADELESGGDAERRARAGFQARFRQTPRWVVSAPGRVNLIGEHTDYNGGFALPMPLAQRCFVAAGPGAGSRHRAFVADLGEVWEFETAPLGTDELPGVQPGAWQSYVGGVLRCLAEADETTKVSITPLDLVIASDVPIGAGLASSAALEVAVSLAATQAWSIRLGAARQAALCRRAEHRFAGVPCGIMDQLTAVMGRPGHAMLIDCRDQSVMHMAMPPAADAVVVVMNTGIRHQLAAGEYANRQASCQNAATLLGVDELRDVGLELLESCHGVLRDQEYRCAKHVITENQRTLEAMGALRNRDYETFGRLMNQSHNSLRDDFRVSCPELDALVEAARGVDGVYGARMTGGGFGGCAIALVRANQVEEVIQRASSILPACRSFIA